MRLGCWNCVAGTVSPSGVAQVRRYIARQEEWRQTREFQEESLESLNNSGTEFDDWYLW